MAKIDNEESHSIRDFATHIVLMVISVLIIVAFLPKDKEESYYYEVGKPWMYNSLIAKFDFPVFKDEAVLKQERDSILKNYDPYFDFKEEAENENVEKFLEKYKDGIEGLPKSFIYTVAEKLRSLYKQGIMEQMVFSEFNDDSLNTFMVISGKEATRKKMKGILSPVQAYKQLFQDEQIAAQREILQGCNLNEYITPNLIYNKAKSEQSKQDCLATLPTASGTVQSGQKIIDRGDIVTAKDYRILESLKKEREKRRNNNIDYVQTTAGQALYVLILLILLAVYMQFEREEYNTDRYKLLLVYTLIIVFSIIVSLMVSHAFFNIYAVPLAMVPVIIHIFLDRRTACVVNIITVLICAIAVREPFDFVAVEAVAGFVAAYSFREYRKRAQLHLTALNVTLAAILTYFAVELIKTGDIKLISPYMLVYFIICGLLMLFTEPLLYLIEKVYHQVSNVTLSELDNPKNELLRELSQKAAGTYIHSTQVATYVDIVGEELGCNTQLLRTAAMYHDIGKMEHPEDYAENQISRDNPLDGLEPEEKVARIKAHVTNGLKIAEKHNLPAIIKEFIATHHGETRAGGKLYDIYKEQHPDGPLDESYFRYIGPNPKTKEEAILMICDTVQSVTSSRSTTDFSEEALKKNIDGLIQSKLDYLHDAPITFRELEILKRVLVKHITANYTGRGTGAQYGSQQEDARKQINEEQQKLLDDMEERQKAIGELNEKLKTADKKEKININELINTKQAEIKEIKINYAISLAKELEIIEQDIAVRQQKYDELKNSFAAATGERKEGLQKEIEEKGKEIRRAARNAHAKKNR